MKKLKRDLLAEIELLRKKVKDLENNQEDLTKIRRKYVIVGEDKYGNPIEATLYINNNKQFTLSFTHGIRIVPVANNTISLTFEI